MAQRQARTDDRLEEIVRRHLDGLVDIITRTVRERIAAQIDSYLTDLNQISLEEVGRSNGAREAARRDMTCIAPGCTNVSKGPRFHYLCEVHQGAPRRDYEAWRRARRAR